MLDPVEAAQDLLRKMNIKSAPVPVEEIAEKLGAVVERQDPSDDSLCGLIYKNGEKVIIGVNSTHGINRQRFSIAHEIGHLTLHSHVLEGGKAHVDRTFEVKLHRDKRAAAGDDLLEIQANKFAAELLMPTEFLKKEIKDKYIGVEDDNEELKKLAKKFEVSTHAMSIKLFKDFTAS